MFFTAAGGECTILGGLAVAAAGRGSTLPAEEIATAALTGGVTLGATVSQFLKSVPAYTGNTNPERSHSARWRPTFYSL